MAARTMAATAETMTQTVACSDVARKRSMDDWIWVNKGCCLRSSWKAEMKEAIVDEGEG